MLDPILFHHKPEKQDTASPDKARWFASWVGWPKEIDQERNCDSLLMFVQWLIMIHLSHGWISRMYMYMVYSFPCGYRLCKPEIGLSFRLLYTCAKEPKSRSNASVKGKKTCWPPRLNVVL